jgi:hypothetical protein
MHVDLHGHVRRADEERDRQQARRRRKAAEGLRLAQKKPRDSGVTEPRGGSAERRARRSDSDSDWSALAMQASSDSSASVESRTATDVTSPSLASVTSKTAASLPDFS